MGVRGEHPERGPAVASWSQPGLGTYSLYEDGTIECACFTPSGRVLVSESVAGASARVGRRGGRMLFRDTRQWFLTIEGPHVAIAVGIENYVNVAASVRRFADQVNEVAGRLPAGAAQERAAEATPEQLRRLAELHDEGVLTDGEFEAKKAQLLERM
jgi:Short C-terminal domain